MPQYFCHVLGVSEEPVSLFFVMDPAFDTADPNRCNNVLQFPLNVNCDAGEF